ncbi:MAG: hypothetical protein H7Y36_12415 [Armatimonadetes bacterium]|nr:hypothetical protein [Akkermansiaceae bacterium]
MANEVEKKPKGGCFGKLVGLFLFLVIGGLLAGLFFITQAQDLSDLGGFAPAAASPASPPRDLQTVLKKSIEGNYSVTLSETELNQWLKRELELKQGGELASWVSLKRVWVRLKEDVAEVIIEREIAGRPFTISMFVQVAQTETDKGTATQVELHGGVFHESLPKPTRGGRFGQLTIPQGFLILVMPDFQKIASLFEPEIELGFQQMNRIKIENKRLVLDPGKPTQSADGMKSF